MLYQIKNVFGIFKKYRIFLIPVLITLAAVIIFVITIMIGRGIKTDMLESISTGKSVDNIIRRTPSKNQWKQEREYQDEHQKVADAIIQLANQSTQRELISYDIFPEPIGTSQMFYSKFGEKCRKAIKSLIVSANSNDAPNEFEISREVGLRGGSFGTNRNKRRSGKKRKKISSALLDAICKNRAESICFYSDIRTFRWYDFWEDYEYIGSDAAIEDCWYSQIAYWIYEDIISTIKMVNIYSECVDESPVKRLLGVSFLNPVGDFSNRHRVSVLRDVPSYLTYLDDSPLGVNPFTGRICNNKIDVVHFSIAVIVKSKSVMIFMKELCTGKEHKFREGYQEDGQEKTFSHNQVTILQSGISPVIPSEEIHEYYRYGSGAVVRLDLICEYIFYRNGYDEIKPRIIKQQLGQLEVKQEAPKKSKSRRSRRR